VLQLIGTEVYTRVTSIAQLAAGGVAVAVVALEGGRLQLALLTLNEH